MQFIKHSQSTQKSRYLISGFSNHGKTTSLPTFIYGPYDPVEQAEEAFAYARDTRMTILTCPGEYGVKSLPDYTTHPHIISYKLEVDDEQDIKNVKWSIDALKAFDDITEEVRQDNCDIVAIDGLHALWDQYMNRATEGRYLNGLKDKTDTFVYSQAHNAFGQYLARWYNSKTPLVVMTSWEQWEMYNDDNPAKRVNVADMATAPKYLWPALPGQMAKNVVGKFDGRVSARLEKKCLHKGCEATKGGEFHYVWQVLPGGDVMGVGIKGLNPSKINKGLKSCPFIHQDYDALEKLIEVYS